MPFHTPAASNQLTMQNDVQATRTQRKLKSPPSVRAARRRSELQSARSVRSVAGSVRAFCRSRASRLNLVGDEIHLTDRKGVSSMKRLLVLLFLVVLVAVAASTALGRNARPAAPAACAKGAVAARIGGKSVCLRAGTACKAAYNSSYKKHGFTCIAGHLRKTPTAKPPTPTPTPTPTPAPVPPYAPPTGPVGTADTTVTVGLFENSNDSGYIVLSQTTIPSGMVTFVITNNCFLSCSFDLQGVKAGAILDNPAQSETWTVALAPGTYLYHNDLNPSGMKGSFTVTS